MQSKPNEPILLLDPNAQAGRTGHRFTVKQARELRADTRHILGTSRADTPDVADLLAAAKRISALLYDATKGDAQLMVELGGGHHSPTLVLSALIRAEREGRCIAAEKEAALKNDEGA